MRLCALNSLGETVHFEEVIFGQTGEVFGENRVCVSEGEPRVYSPGAKWNVRVGVCAGSRKAHLAPREHTGGYPANAQGLLSQIPPTMERRGVGESLLGRSVCGAGGYFSS